MNAQSMSTIQTGKIMKFDGFSGNWEIGNSNSMKTNYFDVAVQRLSEQYSKQFTKPLQSGNMSLRASARAMTLPKCKQNCTQQKFKNERKMR